jgi:hypothetical protein
MGYNQRTVSAVSAEIHFAQQLQSDFKIALLVR